MSIPAKIHHHLKKHGTDYDIVVHPVTGSSLETAEAAHVSGEKIAKGVLLRDDDGYVLAILPATHALRVGAVRDLTHRRLELASESDVSRIFDDCVAGAVPAIGAAYGLETIVDEHLTGRPEIFFEAGDQEELLRVSGNGFATVNSGARFADISSHRP